MEGEELWGEGMGRGEESPEEEEGKEKQEKHLWD